MQNITKTAFASFIRSDHPIYEHIRYAHISGARKFMFSGISDNGIQISQI